LKRPFSAVQKCSQKPQNSSLLLITDVAPGKEYVRLLS